MHGVGACCMQADEIAVGKEVNTIHCILNFCLY